MNTTRTVVTVCLILSAAMFAGCTTAKMQVSNESDRPFAIGLSGGGRGPEVLGMLDGYGNMSWKKTYWNWNLPAGVILSVGKQTASFTVSEEGPGTFQYRITPEGKLVSRAEEEKHDRKTDTKVPLTAPKEVVTE